MVYGMWFMQELIDFETLKKYAEKVRGTVELYGGRYLASDGHVEVIEGTYEPKRTVIVEFPNREMLGKWFSSPEYQAILPFRLQGATGAAIVVHGVE
jgi:uncharacterized protein (DUF1330 family)